MKLLVLICVFLVADIYKTLAAPAATYNQQQTGDLNVRVDLKNISIVAILAGEGLLEDFGEYDYHYDYSDFTLKPHSSTTSASSSVAVSSTSIKPWHTWPTIAPAPATSIVSEIAAEKPSAAASSVATAEQVTVDSESEDDAKPKKNSSSATPSSHEDSAGTAVTNASDKVPSALPEPQVTPTSETIRANEKIEPTDDPAKEKDAVAALPAPTEVQPSGEHPTVSTASAENSETSVAQTQTRPSRKCSPGYSRDQKGRCSRIHNRRRIPSSLLP